MKPIRLGRGQWAAPERWTTTVHLGTRAITVQRTGNRLIVGDRLITLLPASDIDPELQKIRSALAESLLRYPKYRDLLPWRAKASLAIGILWVLQGVVLAIVARVRKQALRPMAWLAAVAWAAIAAYLPLGYLD